METAHLASTSDPLARPVTALRGVGPERAAQLARLEVQTIRDLLWLRPHRHEDRRRVLPIANLELHQPATVRGKIVALGVKRFAHGRKSVFEFIAEDGTARLHCRWWNLPYMQNFFQAGDEVLVFGKPVSIKPRTIDHPETEVIDGGAESSIHLNRIVPVYPLTEGLPQRWIRSLIWRAQAEFLSLIQEPWQPELTPGLLTRHQAIQALHFPEEEDLPEKARQRLALEELVEFQLALQRRRHALLAHAEGRPCAGDNRLIKPFLRRLGFGLTEAQIDVLREIRSDMSTGVPMRRLLQGDVGSGKTVVAGCCALLAIESGYAVALMAPTEILAEQHFRTFESWFEPLGVEVALRTGSCKTDLAPSGNAPGIYIGTHALFEESTALDNLGLVIIDEQHRFGVAQREKLVRKGRYPHLLVMTATPIPRTLGLTLYGDLDISVMRQMPGGRAAIRTFVRPAQSLPKVWDFVKTKLREGRQAFIVFPRVEDTGQGLKAVTAELETVQRELAPHRAGLLHGGLSAAEKEAMMKSFRANEVQVLLTTSLIEVGIDVPNASIMVVENAEQFGLAQLHQLRGRIGRGPHESQCILIQRTRGSEAEQRLQMLVNSSDGFAIAEADLKLRGPGDFLGHEQSGLPPLKFADLGQDLALVEHARRLAAQQGSTRANA